MESILGTPPLHRDEAPARRCWTTPRVIESETAAQITEHATGPVPDGGPYYSHS